MKKAEALALAKQADPNVHSITSIKSIARLWAGMGSIEWIKCNDGISMVAKKILCPNPRSFGDKRKAASYAVEANFYSLYANNLGVICCRGLNSVDDGKGNITILMTPLPHRTLTYMAGETAVAAIRSVARLHAYFWGNSKSTAAVKSGLAPQGTYWYLDTRPDEYDSMSKHGLEGKLRRTARHIDEALKDHPYQTVVHGDLKACNMSESDDPKYVTFVDFQYVGKACPTKDLAYLFVCGMDDFDEDQEEGMLRLYTKELKERGVGSDSEAPLPTLDGLKKAMDLAYCDLYRWMCGWGVWGNDFLVDRVERCLDSVIESV